MHINLDKRIDVNFMRAKLGNTFCFTKLGGKTSL